MPTSTIPAIFENDRGFFDPTTVKLSDSTGTYGVKDSSNTVIVADGTDMTKSSTGHYTYSFASEAGETYTAYVEFVIDDEVTRIPVTIEVDAEAADEGTMGYSVDSLAEQARGWIDVDPEASGGSVPDRVTKTIREWGAWLYNLKDWRFRSAPATVSVASGESSVALAANFHKCDQNIMRVAADTKYSLFITESPALFQRAKDLLLSTDTGAPQIALAYWDESAVAWKLAFAPTADDAYTYPYWYMRKDPWHRASPVADSTIISTSGYWPHTFDTGWELLIQFKMLQHYRQDNSWESVYKAFKAWLADQQFDGDETQSNPQTRVLDVFQHQQGTIAGSGWYANLPGYPDGWLGVSL